MSLRYSVLAGAIGVLGATLFKDRSVKNSGRNPVNKNVHSLKDNKEQLETNKSVDHVAKIRNLELSRPYVNLLKKNFMVNYNHRTRIPNYTMEIIYPDSVIRGPLVSRKKSEFVEDPYIDEFKSTLEDYKGSGYDKGHLVPSGNHVYDQEALDETYVLTNAAPQVSNAAPQVAAFNLGKWEKLENSIRKKVKNCKSIRICTGPLFPAKDRDDGCRGVEYPTIGHNDVAVPPFFYKVLVLDTNSRKLEMESYIMPNEEIDDKTPLEKFFRKRETIARVAGHFPFPHLEDNVFHIINGKRNFKKDFASIRKKSITNKEEGDLAEKQPEPDMVLRENSIYKEKDNLEEKWPEPDTELIKKDFLINYDHRTRIPNYTMEVINPDSVKENLSVICEKPEFVKDSKVDGYFTSTMKDYEDSGFAVGHLAASGNHIYNQEAFDDTYDLTNTAPMVKEFNQGIWRRLEESIYDRVEKYKFIYILAGPLFPPKERAVQYQTIGENDVAVAPSFFKVLVLETHEGKAELESYVFPNERIDDNTPLGKYFGSREYIKQVAGFMPFGCWGDQVFSYINGVEVDKEKLPR